VSSKATVESFWDFSVRTYRTHGVADACLSLQNDYGADVNMLLYCCWIGAVAGRFDDELFARASDFATQWAEHVVIPLRSARTWMKHTGCHTEPLPTAVCMELRENVKSVEFAAEKLQQEALASFVPTARARNESAQQSLEEVAANLQRYAGFAGIDVVDDVRQKLSIIVDAAFPPWRSEDIANALAG